MTFTHKSSGPPLDWWCPGQVWEQRKGQAPRSGTHGPLSVGDPNQKPRHWVFWWWRWEPGWGSAEGLILGFRTKLKARRACDRNPSFPPRQDVCFPPFPHGHLSGNGLSSASCWWGFIGSEPFQRAFPSQGSWCLHKWMPCPDTRVAAVNSPHRGSARSKARENNACGPSCPIKAGTGQQSAQ